MIKRPKNINVLLLSTTKAFEKNIGLCYAYLGLAKLIQVSVHCYKPDMREKIRDWRKNIKIKKYVYIGLAIGAVGAVVPLLPAFPFLLLAAICFGIKTLQMETE